MIKGSISCKVFQLMIAGLLTALIVLSGCENKSNATSSDSSAPASSKSSGASDSEKGAQTVAAYQKTIDIPYSKGRIRMTIVSPDEGTKVYEVEALRKQTADETMTLSHVVKPDTESDLASLSVEKKTEKTQNVSFAQGTGKFVEYDTSKQTFGGLTAQELLGGELQRYNFKYLGEKQVDGVKTSEVESTLKPNEESPITRVVTLFREDNSLPAEIHLFNSKGEEIRTFHITDYKTVDGHPVIWKTVIDNHVRNSKITIDVLNISFPAKMDDSMFTRDNLKRLVVK